MTKILDMGGDCFITADHGNADEMISTKGKASTQHSMNPVPFVAVHSDFIEKSLRSGGGLRDIAPTVLSDMGIALPDDMTGDTLFE